MKPYMAWERFSGKADGAVLVFANTVKEAHKTAWPFIHVWTGCDYIDVAVEWLRDSPHLMTLAKKDTPHVIEHPPICKNCGYWGYELDEAGCCEDCREEIEDAE